MDPKDLNRKSERPYDRSGRQERARRQHAAALDVARALFLDNGYAAKAAIPGVKVGGKTGTAEVGDGTAHSWFIGFAPADAPRVAVAVIMEHQGSGSDFAAPAARQVMRAALAVP